MLVITRYPGQVVWIETEHGPVKVEFLEHRTSGQIRLGFEGPPQVRIYRDEVRPGRERGAAVPGIPAIRSPDGPGADPPECTTAAPHRAP